MKNTFQCFRTISQSKESNGQTIINVTGRVLEKLKINDVLYAKEGEYFFEAKVCTIISYGKSLEEIYPTMGCTLILNANTFLNNSVGYLGNG